MRHHHFQYAGACLALTLCLLGCNRQREEPVQAQRQTPAPQEASKPTPPMAEADANTKAATPASPAPTANAPAENTAPKSEASESSPGTTSGTSSDTSSAAAQRAAQDKPKLSPAAAAREARTQLAAARQAEKSGNAKDALTHALRGYQATRAHPGDSACQQVAAELLVLAERVGESGGGSGNNARPKPFRVD